MLVNENCLRLPILTIFGRRVVASRLVLNDAECLARGHVVRDVHERREISKAPVYAPGNDGTHSNTFASPCPLGHQANILQYCAVISETGKKPSLPQGETVGGLNITGKMTNSWL